MVRVDTLFRAGDGMTPEIAAKLSQKASKYESVISLQCGGRTLMLDSLIGILSTQILRGEAVSIVAEGIDEAEAVEAIRIMLEGN